MNTLAVMHSFFAELFTRSSSGSGVKGIIVDILVAVLIILGIAGLVYLVETYIMKQALPQIVRLIIGVVVLILIVLWFLP